MSARKGWSKVVLSLVLAGAAFACIGFASPRAANADHGHRRHYGPVDHYRHYSGGHRHYHHHHGHYHRGHHPHHGGIYVVPSYDCYRVPGGFYYGGPRVSLWFGF